MKVKMFTASTMQEAMLQVKNELGIDAVILHTRRYKKGGIAGFFGKEMVEVMAAIDEQQKKVALPVLSQKKFVPITETTINPNSNNMSPFLHSEISNMKKMLTELVKRSDNDKITSYWHELLLEKQIQPIVVNELLQDIPPEQLLDASYTSSTKEIILHRIMHYFKKVEGIKVLPFGCTKVAFIGPTGVGKTTTIAKLAAQFSLQQGLKTALITSDTYRIAAVEQLKTYADILNIPIEIVYLPDDLKNALEKHKDKNIVLIDTAGRSPANGTHMDELQDLLSVDKSLEIHLVMSTTTKYQDAKRILDSFSCCASHKLLFTKIDETSNIGSILNILHDYPSVTLSYITNGQNVPEDIELVSPEKLSNLLLKEEI